MKATMEHKKRTVQYNGNKIVFQNLLCKEFQEKIFKSQFVEEEWAAILAEAGLTIQKISSCSLTSWSEGKVLEQVMKNKITTMVHDRLITVNKKGVPVEYSVGDVIIVESTIPFKELDEVFINTLENGKEKELLVIILSYHDLNVFDFIGKNYPKVDHLHQKEELEKTTNLGTKSTQLRI